MTVEYWELRSKYWTINTWPERRSRSHDSAYTNMRRSFLCFEWTLWMCDIVLIWPLIKRFLLNISYTLLNIVLRLLTAWPTFLEAQASIAGQTVLSSETDRAAKRSPFPNPRHRKWSSTIRTRYFCSPNACVCSWLQFADDTDICPRANLLGKDEWRNFESRPS